MKLPSLIFKSVLSQTSVVRRNILDKFTEANIYLRYPNTAALN